MVLVNALERRLANRFQCVSNRRHNRQLASSKASATLILRAKNGRARHRRSLRLNHPDGQVLAQTSKKRASTARRKKPAVTRKPAVSRSRVTRAKATSTRGTGSAERTRSAATATLTNTAAASHMGRLLKEVGGIVCGFGAIIVVLALLTFNINDPGWSHTAGNDVVANSVGRAGAWFADVVFYLFGFMAYLIPIMLGVCGWMLFRDHRRAPSAYRPFMFVRVIGVALMLVTASALADLHVSVPDGSLPRGTFGGGILGTAVAWRLVAFLHHLGTTLLLLALFFCSMTLAFGTSWLQLIETLGAAILRIVDSIKVRMHQIAARREELKLQWEADREREARLKPAPDPKELSSKLSSTSSTNKFTLDSKRKKPKDFTPRRDDSKHSVGDALLEPIGDQTAPRGLAAALAAAREKFVQGDDIDDASLSSRNIARARLAKVTGKENQAFEPTPEPAPFLKDESAATAQSTKASAGFAAAAPETSTPDKKKIAINERLQADQRQTKLFLDVPDSDLPPLSLLDTPEPQRPGFSQEDLEGLSRLLEEKLAEFRITVEVVAVHPGPVITRFEMELAPGIKASRVTGLSQDLARSLSLVSVRVVEVIAGKSTIGIEVPNEHREIVQLTEMLQSDTYQDNKSPLTLALGKDISGNPVTADLGRMPHLLAAGTTGSGKSVAVNAMLISLLYKATAKDVRLILIDPKMLELNVYDGIPHLLAPVVTDMSEAANALRWCVGEMERRYTVMASLKVRNITGYNKKVNEAIKAGEPIVDPLYQAELSLTPTAAPPTLEPMPFIVVVVDEFADMMMQVGKKAEELIARIAQKARAAGIHLILATQRPSVDVITGLIKANVPTRIAFQVSSKIDSRTILDQGGAESLLGHGDMLYQPPGTSIPVRVHGAFVDDHEVQNVVAHIKQTGEPNYIQEILQENTAMIAGISGGEPEGGGAEMDALYDQAVQIVCESRKASISYVQRRLKVGYNRAARMVEDMEAAGVVSAVTSSGTREVLAPPGM